LLIFVRVVLWFMVFSMVFIYDIDYLYTKKPILNCLADQWEQTKVLLDATISFGTL